jgi:hypothetical protein
MESTSNNQDGIVLITVLLLLTLFGLVGLSFVIYGDAHACLQNPTMEIRDGQCVKRVGNDNRR